MSPPAERGDPTCAKAIGARAPFVRVVRRRFGPLPLCPHCGGELAVQRGLSACQRCGWCEAEGVDDIYD